MARQDVLPISIAAWSGKVGHQPRDFNVGHVTIDSFEPVFVVSQASDIAQRKETNQATIFV
jgi:hypothetical protein